jgi:sugar phosphate isomerase/epimerase
MDELKISCGIWFLGATSDRFVKQGYRPDISIKERFKLAAGVDGVGGLEMHYPTEVTDANHKDLKSLADDLGMEIVQFCPHLWVDPKFKFGQFTNADPKLRREALDLCKRTTDIAQHMEAHVMVYWPAQDGYDYPFQIDHRAALNGLVENLAAWCDYSPDQRIVIEYKAWEPRSRILLPTIGHCMTIVNEINRPNLGINIDMGHAFMMKENLAESISLASRYGKLFHTHWNDNWKLFDDDIIPGTVNLWETLEALYWLDEWGYDGWFGLDLFPYREDPAQVVDQTIKNLRFGYELLDRVPRTQLQENMRTSNAIGIAEMMRKMLGSSY